MRHPENVRREFAEQDTPAFSGREAEKDHCGSENAGDLCNDVHDFPPRRGVFIIISLFDVGIKGLPAVFSLPWYFAQLNG